MINKNLAEPETCSNDIFSYICVSIADDMPSSHHLQLNQIVDLILLTDPQKMLDIGVGFGKFGMLAREYLELWNSGNDYLKWTRQIDGIEAFEGYLTPLHIQVYNYIYRGNALDILPGISERYDLILMVDILEHFTYDEGLKVLDQCRRCGRNTIISVPKILSDQKEVYGNPYEEHKYNWKKKDFNFIENKFFLFNEKSTICFFGEDWKKIRKIICRKKMRQRSVRILSVLRLKNIVKKIVGKLSEKIN